MAKKKAAPKRKPLPKQRKVKTKTALSKAVRAANKGESSVTGTKAPKRKAPKVKEGDMVNGRFAKGNKCGYRFKKGEVANPAGRPKNTFAVSSAIRNIQDHSVTDYARFINIAREYELSEKQIKTMKISDLLGYIHNLRHAGGDKDFMQENMNRTEGKVTDELNQNLNVNSNVSDMVNLMTEGGDHDAD